MIQLDLINEDNLPVPDADQFQNWLNQIAKKLNISGEVCIKIVDKTESRDLNSTYRQKDKPTNVLSFPSEIPDFVDSNHLGDLAICAPVVEEEALEQNKSINNHWAHLTIHGCLHLLGYDHIEDTEAEAMEALEIELLAELGIENPYI
ncbi:endoribonuclease YbeY [Marinicella pacifica]|uniref:Endoribonuclease YbeY n=1 Tax=Marinicella pacifica TaxID=1171543 RepID=A0A917CEV9_9GAMM|nr:rRNA maturation RNase YbeY [Marinicella pacifica]GGF84427.1 endoribonuclease YbeY [Marinicella pacifica]